MAVVVTSTKSLAHAIARFRATGNLNLSNKGLTCVPSTVYNYSEPVDPNAEAKWYEYSDPVKMDLSHNDIKEIPSQIGDLVPLTYIDVSSNQLQDLPDSFTELVALKLLDISRNQFSTLPTFISSLPSLASLSCAENKLEEIPDGIGSNQPKLAVVNAAGNQLCSLPQGLRNAKALIKLELQSNKIPSIPADYFNAMSTLTELNLSKNSMAGALPDCFSCLVSLKVLYVRENQISQLPENIGSCSSLVELHAGFNAITSIPTSIGHLSSLRILDFGGNKLTEVPATIGSLTLHMLDLSNNSLQTLPLELGLMTTLRSLPLMGNPMRGIRPSLVCGPLSALLRALRSRLPDPKAKKDAEEEPSRISTAKRETRSGNVFQVDEATLAAEHVQKLILSNREGELILKGTGLKVLPEQVWQTAQICVRLDLSLLQLTSWDPDKLIGFTKLKTLRMTGMGLKEWPLPLKENSLSLLEHLSLDKNPVKSVPANPFASCPNVRELCIAGIPGMSAMPTNSLAGLTQLTLLDLAQNRVSTLPSEIPSLTTLRVLRLRDNSLTSLPEEVTSLKHLEELDLANNSLTSIPPRVGLMAPTLKQLMLEGNILKTIRRTILDRGTPAVLEYLKDRVPTY